MTTISKSKIAVEVAAWLIFFATAGLWILLAGGCFVDDTPLAADGDGSGTGGAASEESDGGEHRLPLAESDGSSSESTSGEESDGSSDTGEACAPNLGDCSLLPCCAELVCYEQLNPPSCGPA